MPATTSRTAAKVAPRTRTPKTATAAGTVKKSAARPKVAPARKTAADKTKRPPKTGLRKAPARKRTSRAPRPKGLEAAYSGRVFRSRLEARWAMVLDQLDINWDYEPSHYQVGPELFSGRVYLDSDAGGYSWDEVAGVHKPYYAAGAPPASWSK